MIIGTFLTVPDNPNWFCRFCFHCLPLFTGNDSDALLRAVFWPRFNHTLNLAFETSPMSCHGGRDGRILYNCLPATFPRQKKKWIKKGKKPTLIRSVFHSVEHMWIAVSQRCPSVSQMCPQHCTQEGSPPSPLRISLPPPQLSSEVYSFPPSMSLGAFSQEPQLLFLLYVLPTAPL